MWFAEPPITPIRLSQRFASPVPQGIGIQDWPDARREAWRNAVHNHRHYQVRILLHSQPADMPAHPLECRPPHPTADQPERRMRIMSQAFYSHARLYDLMFPGGGPAVDFFRAEANRQGGSVLELGCGTGHKVIPIASDGHPCVGLDSSSDMLAEAQRKAKLRGVAVEWMQGDMRGLRPWRHLRLRVHHSQFSTASARG